MKIYTKKGDAGQTSLVSGKSVSKSNLRLDAYGTLDELSSHLGFALSQLPQKSDVRASAVRSNIALIQNQLFNVGSQIACDDPKLSEKLPSITKDQIKALENWIDEMTTQLKPLKNFILPGGAPAAGAFHIARTVCRRAERDLMRLHEIEPVSLLYIEYINRLSDLLFTLSRHINNTENIPEPVWTK